MARFASASGKSRITTPARSSAAKPRDRRVRQPSRMNDARGHMNDPRGHMNDARGHMNDARGHVNDAPGHMDDARGRLNDVRGHMHERCARAGGRRARQIQR